MIALPDTSTEVALATTTLSSAASTITFSSIPGTYTDLRLVISNAKITATTGFYIYLRFNSNTGTNYSFTSLYGSGSSVSTANTTSQTSLATMVLADLSTTLPTFVTADIFSYAGSTNKTVLMTCSNDKNGSGYVERSVGLWRQTSAITSITMLLDGSTFQADTTATLYGIL